MARVKGANKMGFAEGYKQYNPEKRGYGTPSTWRSLFATRMTPEEAYDVRQKSRFTTEWAVLSDLGGFHVDENSMWSDIRKAFRKASMNTHPDRCVERGDDPKVAEENFKEVTAAMVMLEDIYRSKGLID